MRVTQKVNAVMMLKPTAYYSYMKTKISEAFHICISILLTNDKKIIEILNEIFTFRHFLKFSFQLPSPLKFEDR